MLGCLLTVCTYCYKLPSENSFCCISYVLVCSASIFTCLKIFFDFPFDFSFDPLVVHWQAVFKLSHVCESFNLFPVISSFILLWLEKIISTFLNWLRHVLWPEVWPLLEGVLCAPAGSSGAGCGSSPFPCCLSVCRPWACWEWGIVVLNYQSAVVYFSF